MKIAGAWLDNAKTQAVCRVLSDARFQALFVGGCVRNALIGAEVNDIDIATDATPETVTKLANDAKIRVIPTGIEHGTVTLILGGIAHEVTTFRRDVTTDGRHATVAFSRSVEEDARRRDFTMNALYAQADGSVVDPLNGLPDLIARHVRFVGQPAQRITEDYLRILRFFRFTAWYGDPGRGIDAAGLAACAAHLDGLPSLSRERVGSEMRKLLAAPDPAPAIASMAQAGVLGAVLPGANPAALPILVHLGGTDWMTRLAILGGEDAAENLRLSRLETSQLRLIRDEIGSLRGASELGYRFGTQATKSIILGRAALFEAPPPAGWQGAATEGAAARFPVSGTDLMPDLQGAALGEKLRALEQRWIASGFVLSRAELLA
jgi:poly(A) polymerase